MQTKQHNNKSGTAPTRLGIIAGSGDLPEQVINSCKRLNKDIFVVGIDGITAPEILHNIPHILLGMGKIGKAIKTLRKENITNIVMIGKVGRPAISGLKLDTSGLKLLSRLSKLKEQGDDVVFSTIIKFFEDSGFCVVGVEEVLEELLIETGVIGHIAPDQTAQYDIETGIKVALEIGKLDIGQAVIIQRGLILGVEAAEGTDRLISRCKELHIEGPGGVLVKMKKPTQDSRVDLPSIGIQTIENAKKSGLSGIAIEAGSALIINKKEVIDKANELGIFIVGVKALETI